jgi:hypothetical protein
VKELLGGRRRSQGRNRTVGRQTWQRSKKIIQLFFAPIQREARSRRLGTVLGKAQLLLTIIRVQISYLTTFPTLKTLGITQL